MFSLYVFAAGLLLPHDERPCAYRSGRGPQGRREQEPAGGQNPENTHGEERKRRREGGKEAPDGSTATGTAASPLRVRSVKGARCKQRIDRARGMLRLLHVGLCCRAVCRGRRVGAPSLLDSNLTPCPGQVYIHIYIERERDVYIPYVVRIALS